MLLLHFASICSGVLGRLGISSASHSAGFVILLLRAHFLCVVTCSVAWGDRFLSLLAPDAVADLLLHNSLAGDGKTGSSLEEIAEESRKKREKDEAELKEHMKAGLLVNDTIEFVRNIQVG